MDKIERLACLYLAFLNNPAGFTFNEIRDFMQPAYGGEVESSRRKFERDKEDIKELGMNLTHYPDGSILPDGNIAKGNLYIPADELKKLPELHLTALQSRALSVTLLQAIAINSRKNQNRTDRLKSAAKKLFYKNPTVLGDTIDYLPDDRREIESEAFTGKMEIIHIALRQNNILAINYPDTSGQIISRKVEVRGLIANRGRWCLIAYCHKAKDIRSFYIDRIAEIKNLDKKFQPDKAFKIKNYSLHSLALRMHEEKEIRLLIGTDHEENLSDFLSDLPESLAKTVRIKEREVYFRTTNSMAFFSWMVRNPGAVLKLGPADIHKEFERYITDMKERHE